MRAAATLLLLALLAPTVAQAEVWKWTDSAGQTHYGDSPPAGVKASKVGDAGVSVIPSTPTPEAAAPAPAAASPARAAPTAERPASNATSHEATAEREAKRQRMIERCERERGVDCEYAVDGMLDGTPPANSAIEGPVWIVPTHPPHKPHPPVKPKPKPSTTPDDPLNYPIAPFPKPVKPK
ncbi:DUF4124 domain-containing protein [Niveibacterium sp. COAC-50]|uniref:DUF4124 domain-containing protein n=1 Tax=Niveibacterium sp. COAC-50 TaxID=2729384 RepID=UPI0015554A86|nr:DUF4124 domain-containing protein [Niveibacterium sp. COAC-50]